METQFGTGAVKDTFDSRDIQFHEIAMGTTPFDWETGFDVEDELTKRLHLGYQFKIPIKDQNGSGSCGGQAWSYYGEVLETMSTGTFEERSAKFIYSQTFVPPAGSAGRTNSDLVVKKGWGLESLTPSYDNGNAPGEEFMERAQDITAQAFSEAMKSKALLYANVVNDIDLMAQACRDNYGLVIGINGKNNGTWHTAFPTPETTAPFWAHWLYVGKVKMINGKKHIGVLNSWGNVGENGWQWLSEDWFKKLPLYGVLIWYGWTLKFKPQENWHYNFTATLKPGSRGHEVTALQHALYLEGMFSGIEDGIFGKITRTSVMAFQKRYSLIADGIVGKLTNAKLNQLYG